MVNLIVAEESLNDIELVIFDKDGTLFDLHKYWSFVIKERAKYFASFFTNHEVNSVFSMLIGVMGLIENDRISKIGPIGIKPRDYIIDLVYSALKIKSPNFSMKDVEYGFELIDSIIDNNFGKVIKKLPGVDEIISALKERGCLIVVATTDIEQRAITAFEYAKMLDYFDYIVGSDQVLHSKPDSEMVDVILDKFNYINRDNVVLIGDSISDLEMAKNANINFIGVTTGANSDEFIRNSEFLVESLLGIEVKKSY
jgi:phosphoglycolate phosphatase